VASFDGEYRGSYGLKLWRKVVQAAEIVPETDGCNLICEENKGRGSVVREGIVASLRGRYAARLKCRRDVACLILLLLGRDVSYWNDGYLDQSSLLQ